METSWGSNETTASALVAAAMEGQASAMDELVRRYGRLVRSAARRVLASANEVDDVEQETWITFLRCGHQLTDPNRLGGWLHRVATNAAYRKQRRASHDVLARDGSMFETQPAEAIDVVQHLHHEAQRQAVREAMASLNDLDRELLELLLADEGLDYREIGRRCGRPIGSLGPTRERLIRKLRAAPAVRRLAAETMSDLAVA